jgi:hypothetical protein
LAYATIDELAAALRIRVTAENTAALQACLDAAAIEIDHETDRPPVELTSRDWLYADVQIAADPGPGNLRTDHFNPPAVTNLYVDTVDAVGIDQLAALQMLAVNDAIELSDAFDSSSWARYTITAVPVNNAGWFTIPVGLANSSILDLADGMRLTIVALRPTQLLTQQLALANRVNILRGVEWFKSQDAAFGVIGFDESGALRAPRDSFNRHAYALSPLKKQVGVA